MCRVFCTSPLTPRPDVQYKLHINNGGVDYAAIHAGRAEGDEAALGARRAEARGLAGAVPRADQEPRAPVVPDDAAREGARHAAAGRQGVLLPAGDAPTPGVPLDARRAG